MNFEIKVSTHTNFEIKVYAHMNFELKFMQILTWKT
jgi:hypothetical protein